MFSHYAYRISLGKSNKKYNVSVIFFRGRENLCIARVTLHIQRRELLPHIFCRAASLSRFAMEVYSHGGKMCVCVYECIKISN